MIVVYLMPVWSDAGSNDMDMVVVRVVMGIDQQWLSFISIPHLLEITVGNIEKLLVGVLCSLAADSHMELGVLDVCVP